MHKKSSQNKSHPANAPSLPARALLRIVQGTARLPWPFFAGMAHLIRWVVFGLGRYRKVVVLQNLSRSFPELDSARIRRIQQTFERHFAELLAETLKGFAITAAALRRRLRVEGMEHVQAHLKEGRSVLVMAGHYGNWEWLGHALAIEAAPWPAWAVYKPLSNKAVDWLMQRVRSHLGLQLCPQPLVPRMLRELKRRPGVAYFIADQTPLDLDHAHWLYFLGQDTPFFHGVDKIARTTGFPVFYARMEKKGWAHYHVTIEPLVPEPRMQPEGAVTLAFARRLEAQIRQRPEHWLWTHRRWKRSHLKPAHAIVVDESTPA